MPPEAVEEAKGILVEIRAVVPQLKELVSAKPIDFDAVEETAGAFWDDIERFEETMGKWGANRYVPQFKLGSGITVDIPEGFITPSPVPASTETNGQGAANAPSTTALPAVP